MKILTEIFRDKNININGTIDQRAAVRAVVLRGRTLLMVYSPVNGDYKFPGGGVDEYENHEIALKREVAEECGMNLTHILREIGCYHRICDSDEKRIQCFQDDLQLLPV